MPLVSIIIINYNGGDLNARCMAALEKQTVQDFEVIFVDNASTDNSLAEIKRLLPSWLGGERVKLLELKENTGFAGGNNAGAAIATGEWLVLLNNDAFPDPDWLEQLLAATRAYPAFSVFSSRQYCYNAPHLLDGTGDMLATNGRAWRRDYRTLAGKGTNTTGEVFAACAAAAMVKKAQFEGVGGFDEDYFCHFEDVDLSFRLRLAGKRCLYVHEAVVYHIGSATVGGEESGFALYQGMRNSVWTFVKCMPTPLLWRYMPAFLAKQLRELYYHTRTGKGRVAFRAKWHALKGLPKMLRKRRAVQSLYNVAPADLAALIIRDPGPARRAQEEHRA